MIPYILRVLATYLLVPLLASSDWSAREAAEKSLLLLGDWHTVTRAWATSENPEERARLQRVRATLTVREVDAIAGNNQYPCDLDVPAFKMFPVPDIDPPELCAMRYEDLHPLVGPIDWCRPESNDEYTNKVSAIRRANTRACLIKYVSRTGNWNYVRKVLEP